MKVRSSIGPAAVPAARRGTTAPAHAPEVDKAAKVKLSSDAEWIRSLRGEAASMPPIRQDVVDQITKSIADGSYEKSVDWNAAIDGVASDL